MGKIKITEMDIKEVTEDPKSLFEKGMPNAATKQAYTKRLKAFLCDTLEDYLQGDKSLREEQRATRLKTGRKKFIEAYLDADYDIRLREFVTKTRSDPKWAKNLLITFAEKLKERTEIKDKTDPMYLEPSTLSNQFKPIKKLFEVNDIDFNWSTIENTLPPVIVDDSTRAYTDKEIKRALRFCDVKAAAGLMIYATSAIRRGGISFQWQHLVPIYRIKRKLEMGYYNDEYDTENPPKNLVCAMITIYPGDREQYIGLITHEAYHQIKLYYDEWTQLTGRPPKPDHPFMRKDGVVIKELSANGFAQRLGKIFVNAKIRKKATATRKHDVPLLNGIRRYVNDIFSETFDKDSTLGALIRRERIMGHNGLIKLDRNYFKTHWRTLIEEYLKVTPYLLLYSDTKKDEKIKQLEEERSNEESLKQQIKNLQDQQKRHDDAAVAMITKLEQKLENVQKQLDQRNTNQN